MSRLNPAMSQKSSLAGDSMGIYRAILRPLLFRLDPEQAHDFAHRVACTGKPLWPVLAARTLTKSDALKVNLFGREFANPVGLAAGFDKNGHLPEVLGYLGFGHMEVGSVTARASEGNPRPRLFRLSEDRALINRMGLNGEGAAAVATRLAASKFTLPVGINIAKTHDPQIEGDKAVEDILESFHQVKQLPITYVTINASCPNTREAQLAESRQLDAVLGEVSRVNFQKLPVLLKLSPDSSDSLLESITDMGARHKLAGYVCGNTTVTRNGLVTSTSKLERIGPGGLSGQPLKHLAQDLVRRVYKLKSADQSIIAAGGVESGQDAFDFVRLGASLVQIYTALIYEGPGLPLAINRELARILEQENVSLADAVGAAHR